MQSVHALLALSFAVRELIHLRTRAGSATWQEKALNQHTAEADSHLIQRAAASIADSEKKHVWSAMLAQSSLFSCQMCDTTHFPQL